MTIREEFEKWAADYIGEEYLQRGPEEHDEYEWSSTQDCWEAFQACWRVME